MNPSYDWLHTGDRFGRCLQVIGTALLAACGSGSVGNAVPPDGERPNAEAAAEVLPVSLRVDITPGKPGAPTESIELRREAGSIHLSVSRVQIDGTEQSGTATLSDAEAADLRNGPLARILSTFDPATVPNPVVDFGVREVRVQRDAASELETWTWDRTLVDELPANTLFRELATLARDRVPDVLLAYFPR